MRDLIEVTALVVAALERSGVPYTIGGSLASSFSGEPRASVDADILVDMTAAQAAPFLDALGDQFYVDADALAARPTRDEGAMARPAYPPWSGVLAAQGILLPPAFAAVLMSASTVIVAINAQRLRRAKLWRGRR